MEIIGFIKSLFLTNSNNLHVHRTMKTNTTRIFTKSTTSCLHEELELENHLTSNSVNNCNNLYLDANQESRENIINIQFNLILNTVYLLGISPIIWDPLSNTAKVTTSKWNIVRWLATMFSIITGTLFLLHAHVLFMKQYGFQFSNMYYMMAFVTFASCILSLVWHGHTAFRRHELVALINGLTKFLREFEETKYKHMRPSLNSAKLLFSRITTLVYIGFLLASLSALGTFAAKCEFHLHAMILSVCSDFNSDPYEWWWKSPFFFILMCGLQFFWTLWQAFSILILATMICATVVFPLVVVKEISSNLSCDNDDNNGLIPRAQLNHWIHIYRSLQVLSQYVDNCFSNDIWPSIVSGLTGITIFLLPLALRSNEVFVRTGAMSAFIFFMLLQWGFLEFGSILSTIAYKFAKDAKINEKRPLFKKIFYSFEKSTSFRVRVGSFGCISKKTIVIVFCVVLENTCTMLILSKEASEI